MNRRLIFLSALFLSLANLRAIADSFCKDPALCTDINAGRVYLGSNCFVAKNKKELTALYKIVENAQQTGASQTTARAIEILNFDRKEDKLPEVTLDNFNSKQNRILFLAISLKQDKKYQLSLASDGDVDNQVNLTLESTYVEPEVDRKPQDTPGVDRQPEYVRSNIPSPFFKIVALALSNKALSDELNLISWYGTTFKIEAPQEEIADCVTPK